MKAMDLIKNIKLNADLDGLNMANSRMNHRTDNEKIELGDFLLQEGNLEGSIKRENMQELR